MFLAVLLNWRTLSADVPDLWQGKTEGLIGLLYVQKKVGKITNWVAVIAQIYISGFI